MERLFHLSMLVSIFIVSIFTSCGQADFAKPDIIGGMPASEAYPWFVQLLDHQDSPQGSCGGALIAHRVVLTAAHCLELGEVSDLHVGLGVHDGPKFRRVLKVESSIIYPGYSLLDSRNDVAVLYLEDYPASDSQPIALNQDPRKPSMDDKVRVIGLGNTTSMGTVLDGIVREVDLPIVDLKSCSDRHDDIDDKQICTGDWQRGGIDSADGDSGGPLVLKIDGEFKLVALVSFGGIAAQKGVPGVSARVSSYVDFIKKAAVTLRDASKSPLSKENMATLVQTRCGLNFGSLSRVEQRSSARYERFYKLELDALLFVEAEDAHARDPLSSCEFVVNRKRLKATVVRPERSDEHKASATIVVSVDGKPLYESQPVPLNYRSDTLNCSHAGKELSLENREGSTEVFFDGMAFTAGDDTEISRTAKEIASCTATGISVAIYRSAFKDDINFAAKIDHPTLGKLVVTLDELEEISNVTATINFNKKRQVAILNIANYSDTDIFTWQISCPKQFTLSSIRGLAKTAEKHGSFYDILFDSGAEEGGKILAGETAKFRFSSADRDMKVFDDCIINEVIPVKTTSVNLH